MLILDLNHDSLINYIKQKNKYMLNRHIFLIKISILHINWYV